jgi:hypothetical protein
MKKAPACHAAHALRPSAQHGLQLKGGWMESQLGSLEDSEVQPGASGSPVAVELLLTARDTHHEGPASQARAQARQPLRALKVCCLKYIYTTYIQDIS